MKKNIIYITIIIILLDQITKFMIENYLTKRITIIKNFFYLNLVHNKGAAWGIFNNQIIFLIIFTIIALIVLLNFIKKFKYNIRNSIAFGLVIGGLLGNFIDRIFRGYVIDFIDIYIFSYDYPVFNISDIAIVVGMILLIYAIIKGEDESGNKSRK